MSKENDAFPYTIEGLKARIIAMEKIMADLPFSQELRCFGSCMAGPKTLSRIKTVKEVFSDKEAKIMIEKDDWILICSGKLGNKRTVYLGHY